VAECDVETSTMKRPIPTRGMFSHEKKILYAVQLTSKTCPKTGTNPKIQLSPSRGNIF
jgi:hypothetical protein